MNALANNVASPNDELTFADLCDTLRQAKAAHLVTGAALKRATADCDSTHDVLIKARRALDEFCNRVTEPTGEPELDSDNPLAIIAAIVDDLAEPITTAAIRDRLHEPNSKAANSMIASVMEALGYARSKRRRAYSSVLETVWLKLADA